MTELRIATRRSQLAVAQSEWVAGRLSDIRPDLEVRLVEITTAGDTDRTSPVAELSEVGAFVRAVQRAVLAGDADLAVHSCKDLPVTGPGELEAFYPVREAPWDVLCGTTLQGLRRRARVGTGSPRRRAQLEALRPDVEVLQIRGNIDTRLGKVLSGEYDAVVLAEAGLRRLGSDGSFDHRFSLEEMVPAPGQGAIAVEVIRGSETASLLRALEDDATRTAVSIERTVLERTGAGCRAALGALGEVGSSGTSLTGYVEDGDGARRATVCGDHPDSVASGLIEALGL